MCGLYHETNTISTISNLQQIIALLPGRTSVFQSICVKSILITVTSGKGDQQAKLGKYLESADSPKQGSLSKKFLHPDTVGSINARLHIILGCCYPSLWEIKCYSSSQIAHSYFVGNTFSTLKGLFDRIFLFCALQREVMQNLKYIK